MINCYEKSYDDSSEQSQSLCHLKSIQEMLHEQSSFNNTQPIQALSLRIKALVIRAIVCKNVQAGKSAVRRYFYKWYAKSKPKLYQHAIHKFVAAGKISTFQTYCLMKIIAQKQAQDQISLKNKQQLRQFGQFKQKITYNASQEKKRLSQQISINNIMIGSDKTLKDGVNEINGHKQSISQIGAPSSLKIEMISCAKLFDSSSASQNKKSSRLASLIEIARVQQKVKNKLLFRGFRKLVQNMLEQDYEEELLKAKRNLELVEQNFMVQCEIEALSMNYEEQTEHLDTIDKNLQTLKQKFLSSQTSSLLKVLGKIFYPQMLCIFSKLANSSPNAKSDNKVYEIFDVHATSLTSLSDKTHSNHLLLYEKQFEEFEVTDGFEGTKDMQQQQNYY